MYLTAHISSNMEQDKLLANDVIQVSNYFPDFKRGFVVLFQPSTKKGFEIYDVSMPSHARKLSRDIEKIARQERKSNDPERKKQIGEASRAATILGGLAEYEEFPKTSEEWLLNYLNSNSGLITRPQS